MAIVLVMSITNVFGQYTQVVAQENTAKNDLALPQPDSLAVLLRYKKKRDSLSKRASNIVENAQEKIDSLQQKLETGLNRSEQRVNSKFDNLQQKVHDKLPVNPALNQSSLVGNRLEGINQSSEKLHTIKLKVDAAQEKVGDLKLSGLEKGNELKSLKEAQLSKDSESMESFEHLSKVKEDISKLKDGHLDKTRIEQVLAQKVQSLEGISALEAKKSAVAPSLEEYNNMTDPLDEFGGMEKLKDSDVIGKETVNHIKVLATDYLAQHGDKLKAAQDKLSKFKKKFGELESINNIPTRTDRGGNPLKGKTFGERLILGGNFQIYKGKPFGLDISPQLAYKLTPKFRLGIGGVYRTSFGNDDISLSPTSQPSGPARPHGRERSAYGFSAYLAHDVYKSFYAHGEFEKLNTRQAKELNEVSKPPGNWHESAYLGIGKTYQISQKVKGNIMILYDVLNDKTNPYRKPWNIRFGFRLVKDKRDE